MSFVRSGPVSAANANASANAKKPVCRIWGRGAESRRTYGCTMLNDPFRPRSGRSQRALRMNGVFVILLCHANSLNAKPISSSSLGGASTGGTHYTAAAGTSGTTGSYKTMSSYRVFTSSVRSMLWSHDPQVDKYNCMMKLSICKHHIPGGLILRTTGLQGVSRICCFLHHWPNVPPAGRRELLRWD